MGLATGLQDKFSWKGVGLAALGGAIGGGLGKGGLFKNGAFSNVGKSAALQAGLRGATASVLSQGIATTTGLQSKFNFAGVAAAGVGAAAGSALGSRLGGAPDSFGNRLATHTASGIANAATRSAIEGSSFSRNLVAAIPDVIGQAVGGAIGREIYDPAVAAQKADPVSEGRDNPGVLGIRPANASWDRVPRVNFKSANLEPNWFDFDGSGDLNPGDIPALFDTLFDSKIIGEALDTIVVIGDRLGDDLTYRFNDFIETGFQYAIFRAQNSAVVRSATAVAAVLHDAGYAQAAGTTLQIGQMPVGAAGRAYNLFGDLAKFTVSGHLNPYDTAVAGARAGQNVGNYLRRSTVSTLATDAAQAGRGYLSNVAGNAHGVAVGRAGSGYALGGDAFDIASMAMGGGVTVRTAASASRLGLAARSAGAAESVSSPSAAARAFQGKGAYPGVDRFRDVTLKEGTVIYAGEPGASGFFTTSGAFRRTGNDAQAIFEGLQVSPRDGLYRPGLTQFVVTKDTSAAFGIVRQNPQFGSGGLPQIYIENFSDVTRPVVGYPLINRTSRLP